MRLRPAAHFLSDHRASLRFSSCLFPTSLMDIHCCSHRDSPRSTREFSYIPATESRSHPRATHVNNMADAQKSPYPPWAHKFLCLLFFQADAPRLKPAALKPPMNRRVLAASSAMTHNRDRASIPLHPLMWQGTQGCNIQDGNRRPNGPIHHHLFASSPSFHPCSAYPSRRLTSCTVAVSPVFLPALSEILIAGFPPAFDNLMTILRGLDLV